MRKTLNGLNFFEILPNETTIEIFSFLTIKELIQIRRVCKDFLRLCDAELLRLIKNDKIDFDNAKVSFELFKIIFDKNQLTIEAADTILIKWRTALQKKYINNGLSRFFQSPLTTFKSALKGYNEWAWRLSILEQTKKNVLFFQSGAQENNPTNIYVMCGIACPAWLIDRNHEVAEYLSSRGINSENINNFMVFLLSANAFICNFINDDEKISSMLMEYNSFYILFLTNTILNHFKSPIMDEVKEFKNEIMGIIQEKIAAVSNTVSQRFGM